MRRAVPPEICDVLPCFETPLHGYLLEQTQIKSGKARLVSKKILQNESFIRFKVQSPYSNLYALSVGTDWLSRYSFEQFEVRIFKKNTKEWVGKAIAEKGRIRPNRLFPVRLESVLEGRNTKSLLIEFRFSNTVILTGERNLQESEINLTAVEIDAPRSLPVRFHFLENPEIFTRNWSHISPNSRALDPTSTRRESTFRIAVFFKGLGNFLTEPERKRVHDRLGEIEISVDFITLVHWCSKREIDSQLSFPDMEALLEFCPELDLLVCLQPELILSALRVAQKLEIPLGFSSFRGENFEEEGIRKLIETITQWKDDTRTRGHGAEKLKEVGDSGETPSLLDKKVNYEQPFIAFPPFEGSTLQIIQFTRRITRNPYFSSLGKNLDAFGLSIRYTDDIHHLLELVSLSHSTPDTIVHLHHLDDLIRELPGQTNREKLIALKDLFCKIKNSGARLIWTRHNPRSHDPALRSFYDHWFKETSDEFDAIICLGNTALEHSEKNFPSIPHFSLSHPSYLFPEVFAIDREEVRKQLGIFPGETVFLIFGNIRSYKDLTPLLSAFHAVKETRTKLFIVGGSVDLKYENILRKIVTDDDRIVFETGFQTEDRLFEYLSAADMAVFNFDEIFSSGSVLLALSCGLPVLVPNLGCLSETVLPGKTGLWFEKGSSTNLSSMMSECAQGQSRFWSRKTIRLYYAKNDPTFHALEHIGIYGKITDNQRIQQFSKRIGEENRTRLKKKFEGRHILEEGRGANLSQYLIGLQKSSEIEAIGKIKEKSLKNRVTLPGLIDIIIPVYNALPFVRRCLESVFRTTDPQCRVIIVNDGSDDFVKTELDRIINSVPELLSVEVIHSDQNEGYLSSCNRSLEKTKGEFILILNSDTILYPGWLPRVRKIFEYDEDIWVINPVSNHANWTRINRPPGFTNQKLAQSLMQTIPIDPVDIHDASGFCFACRRSVFYEYGLFDTTFGSGYYEETDLCMKLLMAGKRIVVDEGFFVYHQGWASFGRSGRNVQMEKNRQIFLKRWKTPYNFIRTRFRETDPLRRVNAIIERWHYRRNLPFKSPDLKLIFILHLGTENPTTWQVLSVVNSLNDQNPGRANVAIWGKSGLDMTHPMFVTFQPVFFKRFKDLKELMENDLNVVLCDPETEKRATWITDIRLKMEFFRLNPWCELESPFSSAKTKGKLNFGGRIWDAIRNGSHGGMIPLLDPLPFLPTDFFYPTAQNRTRRIENPSRILMYLNYPHRREQKLLSNLIPVLKAEFPSVSFGIITEPDSHDLFQKLLSRIPGMGSGDSLHLLTSNLQDLAEILTQNDIWIDLSGGKLRRFWKWYALAATMNGLIPVLPVECANHSEFFRSKQTFIPIQESSLEACTSAMLNLLKSKSRRLRQQTIDAGIKAGIEYRRSSKTKMDRINGWGN